MSFRFHIGLLLITSSLMNIQNEEVRTQHQLALQSSNGLKIGSKPDRIIKVTKKMQTLKKLHAKCSISLVSDINKK